RAEELIAPSMARPTGERLPSPPGGALGEHVRPRSPRPPVPQLGPGARGLAARRRASAAYPHVKRDHPGAGTPFALPTCMHQRRLLSLPFSVVLSAAAFGFALPACAVDVDDDGPDPVDDGDDDIDIDIDGDSGGAVDCEGSCEAALEACSAQCATASDEACQAACDDDYSACFATCG